MKRLAKILVLAICVLSVFCLLAVSASALDDSDAGYKIVHADSTATYYAKGSTSFATDIKGMKDTDTLVLLDDISIASLTDVARGTLNLNGKTVTFTGANTDRIFRNCAGTTFNIVGPGTLDGGNGGIGQVYSSANSTLNISNATLKTNTTGTYGFNMNTGHLNLTDVTIQLGNNMNKSIVQVYHDRTQAAAEINFTRVNMTNASSVNAYVLISNHNANTFTEGAEKVDFRFNINGSTLRAKNFVQVDDVKGIITGDDNNTITITEPANSIVMSNGGTVDSAFTKLISGTSITFGKVPATALAKFADGSGYATDVPGFLTMIDNPIKNQETVMLADIAVTPETHYANGVAAGKIRVGRNVVDGKVILNLNGHTLSATVGKHGEIGTYHLFYNYNRNNFLEIVGHGNINLTNCGFYTTAIDDKADDKCGVRFVGDAKDAIVVTVNIDNSLSGHSATNFVQLRGGTLEMKNTKLVIPNADGKNNYMAIQNEYRNANTFGIYTFENCTIEAKNSNAFIYGNFGGTKVSFKDCTMYTGSNITRPQKSGNNVPENTVMNVVIDNCTILGASNVNQFAYNGGVAISGVVVKKGTTMHTLFNGYGSIWTVEAGCYLAKHGTGYAVVENPVAVVNNTTYLAGVSDLMTAIDGSANNDVIKLLADITVDSTNFKTATGATPWLTRSDNVKYTIDLNGHTVTANSLVTSSMHYLFYNYNRSSKVSITGHGTLNLNNTGLFFANIDTASKAPATGISLLGDEQGITVNFEMDASSTPFINISCGEVVMKNVTLNAPNTSKLHNYQMFVFSSTKYNCSLSIEDCKMNLQNKQACFYNFRPNLATISLKNTEITTNNVLFRPEAGANDTLNVTIDGGKYTSTNFLYLGATNSVPNTCKGGVVLKKGTEVNQKNTVYGTAWTAEAGTTLIPGGIGFKVVALPKLSANLTLSANIDYNLFISAENYQYVTGAKLVQNDIEYPLAFAEYGNGYIASINNIAPAFIADEFDVEIVFGGETYVWENLSVLDYADRMMKGDASTAEKTAIATMVAYAKVVAGYAGVMTDALQNFDTAAALTETVVPAAGEISALADVFEEIDFVAGEKAGYRFIAKAGVGEVSFTVGGETYTHDFATDDTVVLALHADALAEGVTVTAGEASATVTLGNLETYMGAALANYAAAFSAAYAD